MNGPPYRGRRGATEKRGRGGGGVKAIDLKVLLDGTQPMPESSLFILFQPYLFISPCSHPACLQCGGDQQLWR